MSTVALSAGHIRVNDSNSNAGWSPYNKGGGAPGAEGQNAYQGGLAVNGKINTTNDREGVTYGAGATQNPTGKLVLLKCSVADNPDLNTTYGVELAVGSAEGQHYEYNVAGSGANNDTYLVYNAVGGVAAQYLFVAIDISIAEWREATIGAPNGAAIDFYAVGAQFVVGQAKSENVALDAIDIGNGLTYTGSLFSFEDAVDFDQNIIANRYGWAAAVGRAIYLRGRHVIQATGEDTSTVALVDGYHSTGLFGFTLDSTDLTLAGSYECYGRAYTSTDTRGDLTDIGTGAKLTGNFKNWRQIQLNSTSLVTGSLEMQTLIQSSATFTNAILRILSVSGAATCVDPDFTTMDNVRWVQASAGHAIEITVAGAYTLARQFFEGFGADESTAAAVYNNSGGAVTLNISDGDVPTVRNGAGAATSVLATRTITFIDLPIGAEFRIYDNDGDGISNTLGADREGVESLLSSSYTLNHSAGEAGNIIYAQVIAPGAFEERVQEVELETFSKTVKIELIPEESI